MVLGVEREVQTRQMLRGRAKRLGIHRAQLGEIERFHQHAPQRLGGPILSGHRRHGDEHALRRARVWHIELKGERRGLVGVRHDFHPFVDQQSGHHLRGGDRANRVHDEGQLARRHRAAGGGGKPTHRSPETNGSCATLRFRRAPVPSTSARCRHAPSRATPSRTRAHRANQVFAASASPPWTAVLAASALENSVRRRPIEGEPRQHHERPAEHGAHARHQLFAAPALIRRPRAACAGPLPDPIAGR